MKLKEIKLNFISEEVIPLFLEKPIADITVKDIAQKVGLGEATIYRYFSKKQNLVKAVALKLQSSVYEKYFDFSAYVTGYDKISAFYGGYLRIFKEKRELFRFLNQFDAYCISEEFTDLEAYSSGLEEFKNAYISAYENGIKDGSVRPVDDIDLFYYSSTHSLLELCKKLSSENDIVLQDKTSDKIGEISTLVGIFLYRIKAK